MLFEQFFTHFPYISLDASLLFILCDNVFKMFMIAYSVILVLWFSWYLWCSLSKPRMVSPLELYLVSTCYLWIQIWLKNSSQYSFLLLSWSLSASISIASLSFNCVMLYAGVHSTLRHVKNASICFRTSMFLVLWKPFDKSYFFLY